MKNKSLMILIFVSLVAFTGLLFSVYKIATKDATFFYADGYVSIADAENSEKIYFEEGTSYKRGYGKEVIFKDTENVKQEVGKYNFVFYNNKSINFLNDGVLLDLNEVNASFVPYYNIKSNYLIEYKDNKYIIDSQEKDIVIDNFIGRINENKYIVAGNDLSLKLSSSEDLVTSYYFELNFIDGQTVKIDNDKINIETISDEAYIMVGNNIKIDLSNQVIFYEDEAKINLSEIIINHDENIDILYEEPEVIEPGEGDEDEGNTIVPPVLPPEEYEPETVIEYKNVPYVEFLSSNVNSHKMELRFNVIDKNNLISGPVVVRYVDLQTGQSNLKEYINYSGTIEYVTDGLRSNTDYLVTIYTSYIRNGNIFSNYNMFQRTFSTKDLGAQLQKDYVTNNELSINVLTSENATFTSATVNLYDSEGKLVDSYDYINNGQDINVIFGDLNSNTKYTVKLENITYGNVTYTGGSAASIEQKTLKYNPFKDGLLVTSPVATVNKKDYIFKFDLGVITDSDLAIKGVVYNVYNKETDELVKSIKKDNLNMIDVSVDNDIKDHTTYYYKAVITLNDNEKTIEYETLASNDFNMDTKISPTMRFTTTGVTANTLNGYFTITDVDNTIDTSKSIYIEYTSSLGVIATKALEFSPCPNEESETTKCAKVELADLTSDDVYTINLFAYVDLKDEAITPDFVQIGAIKVSTEQADIVYTNMTVTELDETQAYEKIFEVNIGFYLDELTDEAIKNNMTSFDIMLYEGADATGIYLNTIHIGAETNIVEDFFDNTRSFTLKDFGLTLDDLIRLHIAEGGQISKKYSIKLSNGRSGSDYVEFKPYSLTFEINDVLLGLSDNNATIAVTPILNSEGATYKDNSLNEDTIIGLKVSPNFGNKKYASEIDFVIKDVTNLNNITKLEYSEKLQLDEGSIVPVYKFMFKDYPDFFRRGRVYQIEYTLKLDLNGDGETDLIFPFSPENSKVPAPAVSEEVFVPKQNPSMILFPWVSDTNSVTYKYHVTDIDGSLASDYKVYYNVLDNNMEASETTCKGYGENYRCMILSNLNAKDIYEVYLAPTLIEREGTEKTRVDINKFNFEGVYDLANVRYDLEVGETGLSKYNNLISLKITEPYDSLIEEEKLLNKQIKDRVAYYTLTLAVDGTNKKFVINNINNSTRTNPISSNIIEYYEGNKVVTSWNNKSRYDNLSKVAYISTCDDGISTCLYADYSKLYNSTTFKSVFETFKNKNILITVEAMYDSGNISYLANNQNKYAFQVMAYEEINKNGQIYNDTYLLVHGISLDKVTFSSSALSGVYAYNPNSKSGFVDDDASDNKVGSGKIYFINTAYSNFRYDDAALNNNYLEPNYMVTKNGVEVTFGYGSTSVTVPLVAKELKNAVLNGNANFTFDRVIPAINVTGKAETINGIKLDLGISGITEKDITEENGMRYVYLEIYDLESDNLIKTIKVNKDSLTSQKGTVENGLYKIEVGENYKVDVTSVRTDYKTLQNYSFDYKTGIIKFDDSVEEGTSITITYRIVVDELNVGSTYYLKAYMLMDNKKTYLVDTTSSTYATFNYEFTTKLASEVKVSNPGFDVVSNSDYVTRGLLTTYTLDDIVGIEDLEYEICNDDKSLCVDVSKYQSCSNSYNNYSGTCFNKDKGYTSQIIHDISITEDYDFVFNTNYNLVITALVKETDGNVNRYEVFNNSLNLRKLNNPTLNVIKNAGFKDGKNAYLSFDISFSDPDRVISKPEANKEKGQYIVYLAMGADKTKIEGTERVINVTEDGLDKMTTVTYDNLDKSSAYYLIIEYVTYANNLGETKEIPHSVPYLIYTLGDNGVSVGRIEYSAETDKSILKFGYATNMTRDYIQTEEGSLVPDLDQEAFVAGIVYKITRTSGDNLFAIDGTLIFDEDNKIVVKNDGNASELIGETYYELTINGTSYPTVASYDILFQFYLGGAISANLNTEILCKENSAANYWNSELNECYVLDDTKYTASTMYGNGGTK